MTKAKELLTKMKKTLEEYSREYDCKVDRQSENFYGFYYGALDVDISFNNSDCELRLYPENHGDTFAIYWYSKMREEQTKKYFELQMKVIKAYFEGNLAEYEVTQSYVFGLIKRKNVHFGIRSQGSIEDLVSGENLEVENFQPVLPKKKAL